MIGVFSTQDFRRTKCAGLRVEIWDECEAAGEAKNHRKNHNYSAALLAVAPRQHMAELEHTDCTAHMDYTVGPAHTDWVDCCQILGREGWKAPVKPWLVVQTIPGGTGWSVVEGTSDWQTVGVMEVVVKM